MRPHCLATRHRAEMRRLARAARRAGGGRRAPRGGRCVASMRRLARAARRRCDML